MSILQLPSPEELQAVALGALILVASVTLASVVLVKVNNIPIHLFRLAYLKNTLLHPYVSWLFQTTCFILRHDAPPDELKYKSRWMQCTLINKTNYRMEYKETNFASGVYYQAPPFSIESGGSGTFSVCNEGWWTGVKGGNTWRIKIDNDQTVVFSLVSITFPNTSPL